MWADFQKLGQQLSLEIVTVARLRPSLMVLWYLGWGCWFLGQMVVSDTLTSLLFFPFVQPLWKHSGKRQIDPCSYFFIGLPRMESFFSLHLPLIPLGRQKGKASFHAELVSFVLGVGSKATLRTYDSLTLYGSNSKIRQCITASTGNRCCCICVCFPHLFFGELHMWALHLYHSCSPSLLYLLLCPPNLQSPLKFLLYIYMCIENLLISFHVTHLYTCPGLVACGWTLYAGTNQRRELIWLLPGAIGPLYSSCTGGTMYVFKNRGSCDH